MSARITISISRDTATPMLQRKLAQLQPAKLAEIVGPHLKTITQDHLLANGHNKRGWPTTNFWARAAKATTWFHDGHGTVTIRIDQQGVAQRYYGGHIGPVTKKFLAIPISPEAYGRTPRDFPGAFLIKTPKGAYIVQRGETVSASGALKAITGPAKRGLSPGRVVAALEFLFKLSAGVDQEEDRSVLPDAVTLRQAALTRLEEALK